MAIMIINVSWITVEGRGHFLVSCEWPSTSTLACRKDPYYLRINIAFELVIPRWNLKLPLINERGYCMLELRNVDPLGEAYFGPDHARPTSLFSMSIGIFSSAGSRGLRHGKSWHSFAWELALLDGPWGTLALSASPSTSTAGDRFSHHPISRFSRP